MSQTHSRQAIQVRAKLMVCLREKYALYVHIFIITILNRINFINCVLHIIACKHYVKLLANRNFLCMYLLFDLLPFDTVYPICKFEALFTVLISRGINPWPDINDFWPEIVL